MSRSISGRASLVSHTIVGHTIVSHPGERPAPRASMGMLARCLGNVAVSLALSLALMGTPASAQDGSLDIYPAWRSAAVNGVISETDIRGLLSAKFGANGPSPTEVAGLLDAVTANGGKVGTGYNIDKLITTVIGFDSAGILAENATPPASANGSPSATPDQIKAALPSGLNPTEVANFIASLPMTNGVVLLSDAQAAIKAFVLAGHTGLGETGQHGGYGEVVTNNGGNTQTGGTGSGGTQTGGTGSGGTQTGGTGTGGTQTGGTGTGGTQTGGTGTGGTQTGGNSGQSSCTSNTSYMSCRTPVTNALFVNVYGAGAPAFQNDQAVSTAGTQQPGIVVLNGNYDVIFKNTAQIKTTGDMSNGINVFGVNGAISLENTAAITTSGFQSQGLTVNGGAAAPGATYGDVSVRNSGAISTSGDQSTGITVSQVGGNVIVVNSGVITATGAGASGIQARSSGNAAPSFDVTTGQWITSNVVGGSVSVNNSGAITIGGEQATAIFGQSAAGKLTIENSATLTILSKNYGVGIGAVSGQPGAQFVSDGQPVVIPAVAGGDIGVKNSGAIQVSGNKSVGIIADSLGGNVAINNSGTIELRGSMASAIQSNTDVGTASVINSGALKLGAGASNRGIGAGSGDEQNGHAGGSMSINNSGAVTGSGDGQYGLRAVGAGSITILSSGAISLFGADAKGIDGSAFGTGLTTTITSNAAITMGGAGSVGIWGYNNSSGLTMTSTKDIIANAANSYGIAAIGFEGASITINIDGGKVSGGSGSAAFGVGQSATDDKALHGSAGILVLGGGNNVITNKGLITAANGQAISIVSGTYSYTSTNPETQQTSVKQVVIPIGNNKLLNYADIAGRITMGNGNDQIFNSGKITGDIALGGGTTAVGNLKGGTIAGNITSVEKSAVAIANSGTFTGNVNLGAGGKNGIENLDGGTINSLASIYLGQGNSFTNAGTLSPGGVGVIQSTTITGNFIQTTTGRLVVDINGATNKSDQLTVTGTAKLAGSVIVNVMDFSQVVKSEYKIVTAAGGVTTNGLGSTPYSAADTVGYKFGTDVRGGTDLILTAQKQSDLATIANSGAQAVGATAGSSQSANLGQVGGALAQAENAGNAALQPLVNAIRLQSDPKAAADTLNRLIPQNQGGQSSSTTNSGQAFGNAMLSCTERKGEYAYTQEGQCYYAKATVRRLDREATSDGAGVKEDGVEFMGGVQVALWNQVRLGFALGYESTSSKSFDQNQQLGATTGARTHAGVVIKDQWGPINAYLNLGGSFGSYDHKRFVNLAGIGQTATASQDVFSGINRLRFSYLSDMGPWYFKPLIDIGATYINAEGFTEQNAGAANLRVNGYDKWMFSVMPGIELGGQMRDSRDTIYRPYVRLGATFFDNQTYNITANFDGAATGLAPFIVTSKLDTIFADVEVGVHILTTSGFNIRLDYEGRFGEHSMQNAGTLKASIPLQ